MRRTIITILSTALVVAGSAAIVNAASGPERDVATSSQAAEPKKIASPSAQAHAAVRCRNLGCVNRKLTQLNRDAFKCERLVPLTSYQGYLYTPDGTNVVETSALDFTESGDTPSNQFVVYVC